MKLKDVIEKLQLYMHDPDIEVLCPVLEQDCYSETIKIDKTVYYEGSHLTIEGTHNDNEI